MAINDEHLFGAGISAAEKIFGKGEDKNADFSK